MILVLYGELSVIDADGYDEAALKFISESLKRVASLYSQPRFYFLCWLKELIKFNCLSDDAVG